MAQQVCCGDIAPHARARGGSSRQQQVRAAPSAVAAAATACVHEIGSEAVKVSSTVLPTRLQAVW